MTTSHDHLLLNSNLVTLLQTHRQTLILCRLLALRVHPQQCVSSMKDGNENASQLVNIARAQATTAQNIAVEIRRRNDLYVEHVHHHRRHASY